MGNPWNLKKKSSPFLKNWLGMVLSIPIFWQKKDVEVFHWSSNPFEQTGWMFFRATRYIELEVKFHPPLFEKSGVSWDPGNPNRLVGDGGPSCGILSKLHHKMNSRGRHAMDHEKRWTLPTYYVHPGSNQQKTMVGKMTVPFKMGIFFRGHVNFHWEN